MRRAPLPSGLLAVAVAALGGAAACGPELPTRMWQSEHVRYFSREGDVAICPAVVAQVEAHGAVLADLFGVPEFQTIVSYYKFDGPDDFARNAECGAGASGCALNATVRSPVEFDRLELVRAYLAPYGLPPALLAEGAAAALSCERHLRPVGTWREAYEADPGSPRVRAAGAWLVGYMLRMFRATWLLNLYGGLAPNASADRFAEAFAGLYEMPLDDVWGSAVNLPEQPMRCVWECGRPAFPIDGQPHPLAAACGAGSVQLSVDVPAGGLSRWRVDGAARFRLRSCEGFDEPLVAVAGGANGPGGLLAPLTAGPYYIDATVEAGGVALVGAVAPDDGLSWIECAQAQPVADGLESLGTLSLFYPGSDSARFTRLAAGTDRPGQLTFTSTPAAAVSASLCASCDQSSCTVLAGQAAAIPPLQPGAVLQLPPSPAVTATFVWQ